MKWLTKHRRLLYCALGALLLVAYAGKALHTHSDAYYTSLYQTEQAASERGSGMMDDCPICHSEDFVYTESTICEFQFFATTLLGIVCVPALAKATRAVVATSLRGPPYLS